MFTPPLIAANHPPSPPSFTRTAAVSATKAPSLSPTLVPPAGNTGLSGLALSGIIVGGGFVLSLITAIIANKYKITEENDDDKKVAPSGGGGGGAVAAPTEKTWATEGERIAVMQQTMKESMERREA